MPVSVPVLMSVSCVSVHVCVFVITFDRAGEPKTRFNFAWPKTSLLM